MWSEKTRMLLCLVLSTTLSSSTVQAVKNCRQCPTATTCILENSAVIGGGVDNLNIKFCNYDEAKTYALELSLKTIPACDEEKQTIPKVKSLEPTNPCTADACVVKATLENPIDWAVALNSGEPNILSAKINDSPENPVLVGIFPDVAGAEVKPIEGDFSVCQTTFPVQGWRFSLVEKCNLVTLCRGSDGDISCTVPIKDGLSLGEVACTNDECTGSITLKSSLGCDSASAAEKALISQVKVAASLPSRFVKIGSITPPNSTVVSADKLSVGSSQIEISLTGICSGEDIQVNITNGDNSSVAAVSSVEVSDISVIATLSSGLDRELAGKTVQLQIIQCGIQSEPFDVQVTGSNKPSNSVNSNGGSTPTDAETEANAKPPVGLSGGWIIGGVIVAFAVCGFVAEYWYHRRHNPSPSRSDAIGVTSPNYQVS